MTEPQDPKELERQKLLEEIRRRAEEAELRRIESEEEKTGFEVSQQPEEQQSEIAPAQDLPVPPTIPHAPPQPVDEYRLIELRGKFAVAIDRKDVEIASDLILDIAAIIPDTVELASYEKMLRSLRMELKEARSRPLPVPAVEDDDTREQKERKRQVRAKKIAALMEGSISLYEQEKYDKAAATLKELLDLDPENEEAAELRSNIEKAQELAAEVRAEEARRKADDDAVRPPEPDPIPVPASGDKNDFWGSAESLSAEAEFGLNIEKDSKAVPKVPLTRKIVERASGIKIPVKPIIFSVVMILAIIGGYFIAGEIQSSAGELSYSLLVLPGWHSPSDSLAELLSYSLAEQITADLSRSSDLRIIGPQTAATVKYVRGGPAAAARSLGVMHYLHWNIQTTPASVTFDLTLRDTTAGQPIWSARKQSSIRELPSAVREISDGILTAMELSLEEGTQETRPVTANADAFIWYLEGRAMLGNPRKYTPMDAAMAFDRALEKDPKFVDARVSKAWCYLIQADASEGASRSRIAEAAAMLNDGSALAASSASILATHGLLQQLQGGYEKASEFLTTGIRSYPGDAELRRRLATVAMIRGDAETALRNAHQGVSLDPLNAESYLVLASVYKFQGEFEPALEAYQRAAALSPAREAFKVRYFPEVFVSVQHHDSAEVILSNAIGRSRDDYVLYYRLGRVYQAAGRNIERWEDVLQRSQELIRRRLSAFPADGIARSYLALVLTRLGRQKEAGTELTRALRDQRDHPLVLYNAARAFAMQREFASALEYLDKAIGVRYDSDLVFDMDFFNLRSEAEFLTVVTR